MGFIWIYQILKSRNKRLKLQELTLTIGSSIELLLPGSGSKDGFEHSTFEKFKIEHDYEINMTSIKGI